MELGRDTPIWVFHNYIDSNAKNISNIAAYLLGRSFGLEAHGDEFNRFYRGHGSGETGWAPIMGSTFSQTLTQWSMGEYPDANNMQDDVAIISSKIGYRVDDHVNTLNMLVGPPQTAAART